MAIGDDGEFESRGSGVIGFHNVPSEIVRPDTNTLDLRRAEDETVRTLADENALVLWGGGKE